jgi:hypothetical protein
MAQAAFHNTSNRQHFPMRPATKPVDDAQLLKLGESAAKLEAWMDNHQDNGTDAEWSRMMAQHAKLLSRIIAMPAHTIEGMRVKAARLAHWLKDDEEADPMALSLARDLTQNA